MTVTFVIPVRNDAERLRRCLQSIRSHTVGASITTVVVDNGSVDDSVEVARAAGAVVLELPGLAVSALRNRGAELAGDVVAFVDADHEIESGWLEAALKMLRVPGVGAVGAPYLSPPSSTWVQRVYGAFRTNAPGVRDVAWLGAGNMAMRHETFAAAGGFDIRLEACEDVDLCQRLRHMSLRVVADSRMRSVHYGDPATLKALFVGELWRGRDNLRVTLRGPLRFTDLPSLGIPLLDLLAFGAIVLSPFLPQSGLIATGSAGVFLGLALLRAAALRARLRPARPFDAARAFVVACVYDAARALALVLRAPHRRARTAPAANTAR